MINYILRATFDSIGALSGAIGANIQVTFDLTISKSGFGTSISLPEEAQNVEVLDLRGQMQFVTPEGTPHFLCEGIPFTLNPINLSVQGYGARLTLVFPLRTEQLSQIEDLRRGGKVRIRVTIRMVGSIDTPPKSITSQETEIKQGSTQFIEVEKSKWVEEILPALGWGKWRTIDIPFSESHDDLKTVDEGLSEAQKQFGLGNWADCLIACRKVVEELQPYAKEFVNPVHSDTKGGSAPEKIDELTEEFLKLGKSMLEFQGGVRKMMAAGAHKLPPGTSLDRADAEFALLIAIAVRRYVGLRMLIKSKS